MFQQCGQYMCVKRGLRMSFHHNKCVQIRSQICLLCLSIQSFLLLIWLLLYPCITMSEEELVMKSYERGTIISHVLAHSWKQELNCLCVLAENMKNPTLRWRDRGHGWTSSGLGGSAAVCNTIGLHKQRGKVTGRTVALSNRKETLPADHHHKREDIWYNDKTHPMAGPGYRQDGDFEFYGYPINITMLTVSLTFLVGTREGPVECSPSDRLSVHITRFYAHIYVQTHPTRV